MWEKTVNFMKNKHGFVLLSILFYFTFSVVSSSQCQGTDEMPVCPLIPEGRDVSSLSDSLDWSSEDQTVIVGQTVSFEFSILKSFKMKAYINGCGTDICQTNINGTHLLCTFNNVQLLDNHTQIKVFVFDKYGGAVCFQPVYLYVEGPPPPVKIYDTIVTCDSVMINISDIPINTDLSYIVYGREGLVYNASSNSTIINIPGDVFDNRTGVYDVSIYTSNPAGQSIATNTSINISYLFNLWFSIVEFVIVAENGTFFGVITIEVNSSCILSVPSELLVSSNCSNVSCNIELDLDSIFDEQLSQVDISIPLLPDKRQCGVDIEINKLTHSVNSNTSTYSVQQFYLKVLKSRRDVRITCKLMIGSSASGCHVRLISNEGFDDSWNIIRNGSDAVAIIGPLPIGRYDAYIFDWEENEEHIPLFAVFTKSFQIYENPSPTPNTTTSTSISTSNPTGTPMIPEHKNKKPVVSDGVLAAIIISAVVVVFIAIAIIITIIVLSYKYKCGRIWNLPRPQESGYEENGTIHVNANEEGQGDPVLIRQEQHEHEHPALNGTKSQEEEQKHTTLNAQESIADRQNVNQVDKNVEGDEQKGQSERNQVGLDNNHSEERNENILVPKIDQKGGDPVKEQEHEIKPQEVYSSSEPPTTTTETSFNSDEPLLGKKDEQCSSEAMIVPPLQLLPHQPVLPNSPRTRHPFEIATDNLESTYHLKPDSPHVRRPSKVTSDGPGNAMFQFLSPHLPSPLPSPMDDIKYEFPRNESIATLKQEEIVSSTTTTPTSSLNIAALNSMSYSEDVPVESHNDDEEGETVVNPLQPLSTELQSTTSHDDPDSETPLVFNT